MRYLITFSYDGSNFNGYQRQNGLRTIQGEIEKALQFINGGRLTAITSSGRTDKGVHAICQKAHCDVDVEITPYKLKRALNSNLPEDIHIISTKVVNDDFHARYMVKEKTYKYILNMGEFNPVERNYVYQYCKKLNINTMKKGIKFFKGTHDFTSFTPIEDKKDNCIRTITKAKIEVENEKIIFVFTGNGFLKYQIRNMVGYLIKVGENKKSYKMIPQIIESKDRRQASITAHPEGLYLYEVKYDEK